MLDDGVSNALHFHDSDRARANHTGTQDKSTIIGLPWLKADIPAVTVFTDQANIFGDFNQTFKDNRILIESPDGLTPVTIINAQQTLARNVTIPILSANGDFVITGLANQITDTELTAGAFPKITGVGTIASGTWEGTDIANAFIANLPVLGTLPASPRQLNIVNSEIDGAAAIVQSKLVNVLDADIDAHTSTKITITAKGQLNADLLYTDEMTFKTSVRLATQSNDTLSGLAARDGVTPVAGDRVLVKAQTAGEDNGIYDAAAGAWTRSTDFDNDAKATSGAFVMVQEGTADADAAYQLTTNEPITLGTTSLIFTQFAGGAGEANTISSLGGGTVLTAAVPKSGIDLRTVSIATTTPLTHSTTADLMTFDINDLVNADISTSAAIQLLKLESLTSARLIVGSGTGVPTARDITGDVTISNTGVTAIGAGVIVDADINASAAIVQSKLVNVLDADIDAHTSTKITITAKGQLNSNIVYNDQINTYGAFLQNLASTTMRIPLSATPTMAIDGDFAIDTLITDFSMGLIKYFDGEEMAVVAMPIAELTTPVDGDAVTYNATTDEFELRAPAGGAAHDILSATHSDAATATRVEGDVLFSDATQWNRLPRGTDNQALVATATTVGYESLTLATHVSGASTDLTDTAQIVRENESNTFDAFLQSFVSATMRFPLSATPTMAVDGDIAIDTDLGVDFSHGFIKYFDGEEVGVVAMPIAQFTSPIDGHVVSYNATNNEFELVVSPGGTDQDVQVREASVNVGVPRRLNFETATDFDVTEDAGNDEIDVSIADNAITNALITAHTSTKITINAKGQLNSAIVYTDQLNDFGDFDQTFLDNRLLIERPAGGNVNYTIQAGAIAANRILNLPVITGTDTLAVLNLAQTFTAIQDFGADATDARLQVTPFAGDPTARVNGSIWINDTSNTIFARINGADVDLGAGAGGGEANTLASLGGGTVLTAAVPKSGVQLQTVSIATTAPITHSVTTDLLTFDINDLVDADLATGVFASITGIGVQTQALDMSTNFIDLGEIVTPANPAADILRLYALDVDGQTQLAFKEGANEITFQRAATVNVAASDSSAQSKAMADHICTGLITMDYDTGTGGVPFVTDTVTGGTSGATAVITVVVGNATSGTLTLTTFGVAQFQNNEIITAPTNSFSAQPDGTIKGDDVRINLAIADLPALGGTVQLMEGNYLVGAPITPTANGQRIIGQGRKNTTIKRAGGYYENYVINSIDFDYIEVGDMTVNGNNTAIAGTGFLTNGGEIRATGGIGVYVHDVEVQEVTRIGIAVGASPANDSLDVRVIRCIIRDNPDPGAGSVTSLWLADSGAFRTRRAFVTLCYLDHNFGSGVFLKLTFDCVVSNCIFDDNHYGDGGGQLNLNTSENVSVSGCTFRSTTATNAQGIELNSDYVTVTGCTFNNSPRTCIKCKVGSKHNTITGNVFRNWNLELAGGAEAAAVSLETVSQYVIADNTFDDDQGTPTGAHAVLFQAGDTQNEVSLTNNISTNTTSVAYNLAGTATNLVMSGNIGNNSSGDPQFTYTEQTTNPIITRMQNKDTAAGQTIWQNQGFARDTGDTVFQQYTEIQHFMRTTGLGTQHGSFKFKVMVAGVLTDFMEIRGNSGANIDLFKDFDMDGSGADPRQIKNWLHLTSASDITHQIDFGRTAVPIADAQAIGEIRFRALDADSSADTYGQIVCRMESDAVAAQEEGSLFLQVMEEGTRRTFYRFNDAGGNAIHRWDVVGAAAMRLRSTGLAVVSKLAVNQTDIDANNQLVVTLAADAANGLLLQDPSEGQIRLYNGDVAPATEFSPIVEGTASINSNRPGLNLQGQIDPTVDSGSTPVVEIIAQQSDNTDIVTRPLFTIRNNLTTNFKILVDGTIDIFQNPLTWGTDGHSITPSATALTLDLGAVTDQYIFQSNSVTRLTITDLIVNAASGVKFQENGINLSVIGTHDVFLDAKALKELTTGGAGAIADEELGAAGHERMVEYMPFAVSVSEHATGRWLFPQNWNAGTVDIEICFYSDTVFSGTGTVRWVVRMTAVDEGGILTTNYPADTNIDVTPAADTVKDIHFSAFTTITIGDTPSKGDLIFMDIERAGDDGTDDHTGDARLISVRIRPTLDAATAT